MDKLEALDRGTVRSIRVTDETIYVKASIDWPERWSILGGQQPAIAIEVKASASFADYYHAEDASEAACEKAVRLLRAAFRARFPGELEEDDEDVEEVETPATRTRDICDQLTRYGGAVYDPDLLGALWALTDVNDDLQHDRDGTVVVAAVDRAIAHLETLKRKQVSA